MRQTLEVLDELRSDDRGAALRTRYGMDPREPVCIMWWWIGRAIQGYRHDLIRRNWGIDVHRPDDGRLDLAVARWWRDVWEVAP